MKTLYFAYGSNMDLEQMKARCPDSEFLKVVVLKGHEFAYEGSSVGRAGAVANIKEKAGSVVYGALFHISEEDEKELDRYEGYPFLYKKKLVKVEDQEGNEYEAMAYYMEGKEPAEPSDYYRGMVVNAARKLGLPTDYIKKYLDN